MKILSRLSAIAAALVLLWFAPHMQARQTEHPASQKDNETPPAPLTQPAALAKPALWKVSDGDTTIWLFGTVHVLPKGIDWLHGPVTRALEGSNELVTEIVEPGPDAMAEIVGRVAGLPAGQSLRAMLSEDERKSYEAALASLKVPATMFDRYDIWYAAIGLSTLPLFQEGYATSNGVDAKLVSLAAERGMPHQGLETPEYQIGLFDTLPLEVQHRYLSEVLGKLPTIRADLKAMVEAWKVGDADELARLMNEDESDPALMEVLLTNRNRAWAKWIEQRLEKPGTVFVAVGAGHLAGPSSVQEQLAAANIQAVRVQ